VMIVALLAAKKSLDVANREEAIRRDLLASAEARTDRRRTVEMPRPTPVEVNVPQPLSAVRAGLVRPVARHRTAANGNGVNGNGGHATHGRNGSAPNGVPNGTNG